MRYCSWRRSSLAAVGREAYSTTNGQARRPTQQHALLDREGQDVAGPGSGRDRDAVSAGPGGRGDDEGRCNLRGTDYCDVACGDASSADRDRRAGLEVGAGERHGDIRTLDPAVGREGV